jgi:hypothetical protein
MAEGKGVQRLTMFPEVERSHVGDKLQLRRLRLEIPPGGDPAIATIAETDRAISRRNRQGCSLSRWD